MGIPKNPKTPTKALPLSHHFSYTHLCHSCLPLFFQCRETSLFLFILPFLTEIGIVNVVVNDFLFPIGVWLQKQKYYSVSESSV